MPTLASLRTFGRYGLVDERHDQVEVAIDVLHADKSLRGVYLDPVEGDLPDVVRRVAVLPLDLDVADGVGVGFGRGDTLHLVDPVLEEAVVAADGRAELLRPSGQLLDLDGEELRLVVVHPLTLLRVVGEVPLAHLHEVPEAVGRSLDALGVLAPELVEVLLHELAVAGQPGVNADALSELDAKQARSIPPSVTAHVGRETFALFTSIVVVLVVVVVTVHESADRKEVSDCRSQSLLHPVIERLAVEVAAPAVHRENARSGVGARVSFAVEVVGALRVVLDVGLPLLTESGLPERLLHDLLGGDRMGTELVGTTVPRSNEIDDVDFAVLAALELQEFLLRDTAATMIAILVVELVAVCREDAIERAHRANSMGHDGDGIVRLRETDVLRRHGREIGLPRVLTGFGREPRLEDVGERCDVAVLTREGLSLFEGWDEPFRIIESHRIGPGQIALLHCDTPFPFLGFWGLHVKQPPWQT